MKQLAEKLNMSSLQCITEEPRDAARIGLRDALSSDDLDNLFAGKRVQLKVYHNGNSC